MLYCYLWNNSINTYIL